MYDYKIGNFDSDTKKLIQTAREARPNAIAPISNFLVGASVLTNNGNIYRGVNVEEAAFNSTIHAEQAALASARAYGETVHTIAICADNKGNPDLYARPCPHCWQCIFNAAEINNHPIVVIMCQPVGDRVIFTSTSERLELTTLSFRDIGIDVSKWRK